MSHESRSGPEIQSLMSHVAGAEQEFQSALTSREEHYCEIAENSDDVFFWASPESQTLTYVSRAYEKLWGYSCESACAQPSSWWRSIHPDDLPGLRGALEEARTQGHMQTEYRIIRADGQVRWIWVRTFPIRNADGSLRTIAGIAQDFTQRKQAEAARAFLASIVESSDAAIVGTQREGIIVSWNESARKLFGYTAEEAIGTSLGTLFPADRQHEFLHARERVTKRERIERYESVRARKDGSLVDVSIIVSPIRNSLGEIQGVAGIYRDITRQKETQRELVRAKEAAEAANRAKSQFLANMSHEIRTPMNGIIGLTDVVLDSELNADQRDCLTLVKVSAEALLVIINDILDVTKIEAGKLVLRVEEFWVRDLVNAVVKGLAVNAKAKNLTLTCEVNPEVPDVIIGDPGRLRQVLINLVGNAIKFSAAGEIAVTAKRFEDDQVLLSVRDHGIGIPAEKQRMIFDAFTQADGSPSRRFGGTGLGLTIAARLVEMMGGKIWVESDGHSGSTFHVMLKFRTPPH